MFACLFSCLLAFTLEGPFYILLTAFCLLCFAACVNIVSLRKIKNFSNLRSEVWLVLRSEVCLALKRVNHATPKRVALC